MIQYDFTSNFNINLYGYHWFVDTLYEQKSKQYKGKYPLRYDLYKKNKKQVQTYLKKYLNNEFTVNNIKNDENNTLFSLNILNHNNNNTVKSKEDVKKIFCEEEFLQVSDRNENLKKEDEEILNKYADSSDDDYNYDNDDDNDENYAKKSSSLYNDVNNNTNNEKNNNVKLNIYEQLDDFTTKPRFINCQFSAQYAYKDEISSKNFWNQLKNLSSHNVPGGTTLIMSIPNLNSLVNLISVDKINKLGMRKSKHGSIFINEIENKIIQKNKSYVPYRFVMHKTLDVIEYTVDSNQLIEDGLHHGFHIQMYSKFSKQYEKHALNPFFEIVKRNMGITKDIFEKINYIDTDLYSIYVFTTQKVYDDNENLFLINNTKY